MLGRVQMVHGVFERMDLMVHGVFESMDLMEHET